MEVRREKDFEQLSMLVILTAIACKYFHCLMAVFVVHNYAVKLMVNYAENFRSEVYSIE